MKLEHILYEQEQFPIFQNRMYETASEARSCARGDIRLVEDLRTGLTCNAAFRPELMEYDEHYQNEQAVSPQFQHHLADVAQIVERALGRQRLVEVGCGKGHFLESLEAKGFDIVGFDPAYEGSNPRILKKFFTGGLPEKGDGLILRHVLEHVEAPIEFLSRLGSANGGRGRIYIEVPCFDWICRRRAWFDIFYEHANYFRLSDFHRMFGEVVESGRIFGGQYLYVVAELHSLRQPQIDPHDRVIFPPDFAADIGRFGGNECAIWGGASKGVIFALLQQRRGSSVATVIDINPAKQGKYLPGTGLRVHSPEEAREILPPGAQVLVMNSNYLREIQELCAGRYQLVPVDAA